MTFRNWYIIIILLLMVSKPIFGQQLVYDLRQDWVYYNEEHKSFLPVEDQNLSLKAISFNLRDS